jgi:hypothetical protein
VFAKDFTFSLITRCFLVFYFAPLIMSAHNLDLDIFNM